MINQIIELKKRTGMVEEDATPENQREWYEYALKEGLIETEFIDGKLVGFVEWVRGYLFSEGEFFIKPETIKTAPFLFVSNLIATNKGVIWRLKKKLFSKNTNHVATFFKRKRMNRFVIIRRFNHA